MSATFIDRPAAAENTTHPGRGAAADRLLGKLLGLADIQLGSSRPFDIQLKHHNGGTETDPWIDKYIFPNSELARLQQIATAATGLFIIEDVQNFGADYERTLLAWHTRFEAAWPAFSHRYSEEFHRMWRYYLLASAGMFRTRENALWQLVLSPKGVPGGYRRST